MVEKRRESEYKRSLTDHLTQEEINAEAKEIIEKIRRERPEALEIPETVSAVVESGRNKIGSWADAIY